MLTERLYALVDCVLPRIAKVCHASESPPHLRGKSRIGRDLGDQPAMNEDVPAEKLSIVSRDSDSKPYFLHVWFWFRLYVGFIKVRITLDIGESVE